MLNDVKLASVYKDTELRAKTVGEGRNYSSKSDLPHSARHYPHRGEGEKETTYTQYLGGETSRARGR